MMSLKIVFPNNKVVRLGSTNKYSEGGARALHVQQNTTPFITKEIE